MTYFTCLFFVFSNGYLVMGGSLIRILLEDDSLLAATVYSTKRDSLHLVTQRNGTNCIYCCCHKSSCEIVPWQKFQTNLLFLKKKKFQSNKFFLKKVSNKHVSNKKTLNFPKEKSLTNILCSSICLIYTLFPHKLGSDIR